jgi:hypothetical protein
LDCIPGQFQDEKGNQKCKECPKDTFAASSKEIGKKNTKEEKKKRNRLVCVLMVVVLLFLVVVLK